MSAGNPYGLRGLKIARREGESFLVGENIRITVYFARQGRARLSIDAPKSIKVSREEVAAEHGLVFRPGSRSTQEDATEGRERDGTDTEVDGTG